MTNSVKKVWKRGRKEKSSGLSKPYYLELLECPVTHNLGLNVENGNKKTCKDANILPGHPHY